MTTIGFVKICRTEDTMELMKDPKCFTLAAFIAMRAKRTDSLSIHGLNVGEAFLGDYQNYGLTQNEYREAKKRLEKWGIIETQTTNKGTVAKLCNTRIFDINAEEKSHPNHEQTTSKTQTDHEQTTTNKNDKNEKNEKNESEISAESERQGESALPATRLKPSISRSEILAKSDFQQATAREALEEPPAVLSDRKGINSTKTATKPINRPFNQFPFSDKSHARKPYEKKVEDPYAFHKQKTKELLAQKKKDKQTAVSPLDLPRDEAINFVKKLPPQVREISSFAKQIMKKYGLQEI